MEIALCYESSNRSCLRTVYPLPIYVTVYTILGVFIFLTVCGNLLVAVSIVYFKQLHTPTNYLIASLATSDFILGLLVMIPSMVQSVETCWFFGDIFCKIYMSSDIMLSTTSILNLFCISIDRHYAVSQPLLYRSKISVNVVFIMILISWTLPTLYGFGLIYSQINLLGIEELYSQIACEGDCMLFLSQMASTVNSIVIFYIPAIIMLAIYLKIFIVARKQSHTMRAENKSKASHTKATRTLAIIMGAFLSFWSPFFFLTLFDPFIIPPTLYKICGWLGYLNSTVNPLIYAFFYSWFRKALRLLISGKLFKDDLSETSLFTE